MHSSKTPIDYKKWWDSINGNSDSDNHVIIKNVTSTTARPVVWPNATMLPTQSTTSTYIPTPVPSYVPIIVPSTTTPPNSSPSTSVKFGSDGSIIIEGVGFGVGGFFMIGLLFLAAIFM